MNAAENDCIMLFFRNNIRALQGVPEIFVRPFMATDDGDSNGGDNGAGKNGNNQSGVVTQTRTRTKKPSMYKVLMLNDDYTPMEFVVQVLEGFFSKSHEEAVKIMLHVHQRGVGMCGVFTYEVAETKVTQVIDYARKNQHPLQCTLEKD
jgi:ATP-dependent Clp protease adaptor protein ClpS